MNIILRVIDLNHSYQSLIIIYDQNNNIVLKKITDYNGLLKFNLNKGIYTIKLITHTTIIISSFIISNKDLFLLYDLRKINYHHVTFKLIDKFYNLLVKRGEIKLWQKNIKSV